MLFACNVRSDASEYEYLIMNHHKPNVENTKGKKFTEQIISVVSHLLCTAEVHRLSLGFPERSITPLSLASLYADRNSNLTQKLNTHRIGLLQFGAHIVFIHIRLDQSCPKSYYGEAAFHLFSSHAVEVHIYISFFSGPNQYEHLLCNAQFYDAKAHENSCICKVT